MDAKWIITAFVLMDTLLERLEHRSHSLAHVLDSEILTIAVVAAKYFQNHHEHALCVLREAHYLSARLELRRFNRRLHALTDILAFIVTTLCEVLVHGEVFVIDNIPVPACRRVRARRRMCGGAAAGAQSGAPVWLCDTQRRHARRGPTHNHLHDSTT